MTGKVRTIRDSHDLAQQISNAIIGGMPADRGKILTLIEANSLRIGAVIATPNSMDVQHESIAKEGSPLDTPSEAVLAYCAAEGVSAFSNQNVHEAMEACGITKEDLLPGIEAAFALVLKRACIDYPHDHNSEDTPKRYAKMIVNETWCGRYEAEPSVTDFPNASNVDQLIVVKRIRVESLCSHHHQNIRGYAWIGVLPHADGKVMGLSKYSRIVRHFARRPQIQEELTVQIADYLHGLLQPRGVAVLIDAEHQCMGCRGVMEPDASTSTTHLLGEMRTDPLLRTEFEARIAHDPHRR